MGSGCPMPIVKTLAILGFCVSIICSEFGKVIHHHKFVVESSPYSRLSSTKEILQVNGGFPGPTLKARRGDKMIIKVYKKATYNLTIHWHGLKQERNPQSYGQEYITQCPIQAGKKFTYTVENSVEGGTVWWHVHNGWGEGNSPWSNRTLSSAWI